MSKLAAFVEYAIWVALVVFGVLTVQYIEWLGCPRDAFICGSVSSSPNTWPGLIRVTLLLVCLAYPAKITFYFATRNQLLRKSFDDHHKRFHLSKAVLRGALVAVFGVVAFNLLTFERIWASPQTISAREYIWSAPVRRSWDNVIAVSTWCKPGGRGSWNRGYELTFRDRGRVNLAFNAGPISERKSAIFSALRGHRFYFDDSGVNENCLADFRKMATQRPL